MYLNDSLNRAADLSSANKTILTMDIVQTLLSQLGEGGIESIASKVGGDKKQVSKAIGDAVPTLLNAISANTKNINGASGFLSALDRDHDGSILDDIGGFLQNTQSGNGAGILKHVLGDNRASVENQLASSSGLSSAGASNLLETIAPLLMGVLGKQKRNTSSGFGLEDISSMIGSFSGGKGFDIGSLVDLATGGGGSKKKSGGAAGILGLLGKLLKR